MITVIIPIYNSEKYLKRCIESVIKQTYEDWELILVDDDSIDHSYSICQKYALIDRRIKVFKNQENRGVGYSRNVGINHANGDYIMFIDSDDYIEFRMLEFMLKKLKATKTDIVMTKWYSGKKPILRFHEEKIMSAETALKHFLCMRKVSGYIWCKLYTRSVIGDKRFWNSRNLGEDGDFMFRNLLAADQVCYTNVITYFYNVRPDSVSERAVFSENIFGGIENLENMRKCLLGEAGVKFKQLDKYFPVFEFHVYFSRYCKMLKFDVCKQYPEWYKKIDNKLKRTWKTAFVCSINSRTRLLVLKYLVMRLKNHKKIF